MSAAPTRRPADEPHCTEVERPDDLLALVGTRLGTSPWLEITQQDVDDFARVTRDQQWIHVDRERAAAGPYGQTIAHGYYVLSLCVYFAGTVCKVKQRGAGINYGLDRVRFVSAVPVGSWLRAHIDLESAERVERGVQIRNKLTIERDGSEKPACVALTVSRLLDP